MKRSILLAVLGGLSLAACGSEDTVASDGASGAAGAAGAAGDSGSTDPLLVGEPSVVLYDAQPMVADVHVSLSRPASGQLVVQSDPGVVVAPLDETASELSWRLRGLAPSTLQTLQIELTDTAGASQTVPFELTTLPALEGFLPSFPVEQPGTPSGDYRLFDHQYVPPEGVEVGGIFVVDTSGQTRFYLPSRAFTVGIPAIICGVKLLDDGTLLYVQDHDIRVVDELGERQVVLKAEDIGVAGFHHDVAKLPNGNFLVMGYEFMDYTYSAPKRTEYLAGDVLAEVTPGGQVVWTWSSFDHLDPERILDGYDDVVVDPTNGLEAKDWSHGNGIELSADGSVLVSLRHQDWILKVERPSGNVAWRLGLDGDLALIGGSWFHHQHSPEWQPDGTLLLYDNGIANPSLPLDQQRSRAVKYRIDELLGTAEQVWEETGDRFMSPIAGDADRTSEGSLLVLDSFLPVGAEPIPSYARLREIDAETGEWRWVMTTGAREFVYRALPVPRLPGFPAR